MRITFLRLQCVLECVKGICIVVAKYWEVFLLG